MEDRKPCPFCGNGDVSVQEEWSKGRGRHPYYFVLCHDINCQTEGPCDLGASGAIAKWNTRYTPPAVTYEAPLEVRAGTPVGVDPLAGLWEDGH